MLEVVVVEDGLEPLFTLEEAKLHLRVDHNDDDTIIALQSDAAVAGALSYVGRDLVPDDPKAVSSFRGAALLMLGDLYTYRATGQVGSASSPINVTASARFLINPWRILTV